MKCVYFLVAIVLAGASAEVISYQLCSPDEIKECEIDEVRVENCPQAAQNAPCVLKRGKNGELEFDFKAKKGATDLSNNLYWATAAADIPLVGVDTTGCDMTTCPITGDKQTLKFSLPIGRKYPARNYEVKWKLHDDSVQCCFLFRIKIEK